MTQSEKNLILAKLQELTFLIKETECEVATLFDNMEDTILRPTQAQETAEAKPRKTRVRITDGTMTATSIASHLSKELGRTISRESVIRVGKQIGAKTSYCESQHTSRYSPEAVSTIMNLYRSFNQL